MIKKFLANERGVIFLSVILLTLIVSLAAAILMRSTAEIKRPHAILRLTALHLANEQFAAVESMAAAGNLPAGNISWQGLSEDLTTKNLGENFPVNFDVRTTVKSYQSYENLREVVVKVAWEVGGKNYNVEFERVVRIAENFSSD